MNIDGQTLLIIVAVGVVAGWLGVVTGGTDMVTYLLFGIVGAFLGNYLFAGLEVRLPNVGVLTGRIVVSAIGEIVLVAIARIILRPKR